MTHICLFSKDVLCSARLFYIIEGQGFRQTLEEGGSESDVQLLLVVLVFTNYPFNLCCTMLCELYCHEPSIRLMWFSLAVHLPYIVPLLVRCYLQEKLNMWDKPHLCNFQTDLSIFSVIFQLHFLLCLDFTVTLWQQWRQNGMSIVSVILMHSHNRGQPCACVLDNFAFVFPIVQTLSECLCIKMQISVVPAGTIVLHSTMAAIMIMSQCHSYKRDTPLLSDVHGKSGRCHQNN